MYALMAKKGKEKPDIQVEKKSLFPLASEKRQCKQLLIKQKNETCPNLFSTNAHPGTVNGDFCSSHRQCFFMNADGTRCENQRKDIKSITCIEHSKKQPCHGYYTDYKTACNLVDNKDCTSMPNATKKDYDYWSKNFFRCATARGIYSFKCIHPSQHDIGHKKAVEYATSRAEICNELADAIQERRQSKPSIEGKWRGGKKKSKAKSKAKSKRTSRRKRKTTRKRVKRSIRRM